MPTASVYGLCVFCSVAYVFTVITLWSLVLFLWDHSFAFWRVHFAERSGLASSLCINIALLGMFFVQHSAMSSVRFKTYLHECLGTNVAMIRLLYVTSSSVVLQLVLTLWRRIPTVILWKVSEVDDTWWWIFFTVHLLSWTLLYGQCLILDFSELMGLKQLYYYVIDYEEPLEYKSRHLQRLYEHRRHPIMGLLIILVIHPYMTLDRFLLALAVAAYVKFFFRVERRDYDYQLQQFNRKCYVLAKNTT